MICLVAGCARRPAHSVKNKKKIFSLNSLYFCLLQKQKKKKKREREETVFACGEAARWRSESLQSSPSSGVDLFFLFCLVINFSFFFQSLHCLPPSLPSVLFMFCQRTRLHQDGHLLSGRCQNQNCSLRSLVEAELLSVRGRERDDLLGFS